MHATPGGRGLALVVDDDPDVTMVCALHLQAAGYDVVGAATGREGLRLAAAEDPAVIVLDLALPDLDGLQVLRQLRDRRGTAETPVVVLTARSSEQDQAAAWRAGVSDYLVKPFEGDRLVAAVDGVRGRSGHPPEVPWQGGLPDPGRDRGALAAAVLDGAQDAVVVALLDGTIEFWNAGAQALYGWAAEEVLGAPISILTLPRDADGVPHFLETVARGEVIAPFESKVLHRDGQERHVSLGLSPVREVSGAVVGISVVARNVSDRVRGEGRLRRLVDAAPDAMVVVDEDGLIRLVNRRTELLFGYRRGDLLGRELELLVPERFRENHRVDRQAYAAHPSVLGGGGRSGCLLARRADGSELPVEITLSPAVGERGSWSIASVRDLSHRPATAPSPVRSTLERLADAQVGLDEQQVLVTVSDEAAVLFGCRPDELVGRHVDVLALDHTGRRRLREVARRALGPRVPDLRFAVGFVGVRRDGTVFPAEISLSAVTARTPSEAVPVSVWGAVRDVSERSQVDGRLRTLIETAPDAVVITTEDGTVLLANEQTGRMFGHDHHELVGRPVELLLPERHRAAHQDLRKAYAEAPTPRRMSTRAGLTGRRADGSEFPVEVSLSPLRTDRGPLVAAWVRDVSVQRRAEEAQALAIDREREASARLLEVDRMRSDFLSTVSHELRTPLTAIRGFSEWLVGAWDETPDDRRRDMVGRMLHAGARLDFLIQDLLDFSRLERGQLKVDLAPQRLAPQVEEALAHTASSLLDRFLQVCVDPDLWVLADRSALARVLENLLTNAAKFSPPGSTVTVTARVRQDGVALTVHNTGVGLAVSEHAKVFDRFYRVPGTAARHPGTGIGLAIVKQFAEAQGARVEVDSVPGESASFTVVLRPGTPS